MNLLLFHRVRHAAIVVLICSGASALAEGPSVSRLPDGRIYLKNEILISLTESYARSISSAGGRRRAVDAAALRALDADAEAVVARHTAAEKWMKGEELPDRVRRLGLPANAPDTAVPAIARGLTMMINEGKDAAAVVERIRRLPQVEWAELNYLMDPSAAPNDTNWGQQWGPMRVGMAEAWDVPQTVTALRVAVVDTGVDRMHPDLSNSIVYGRSFNTNNDGSFRYGETGPGDALRTNLVVAGTSPGTPAADRDHGTHVAGIAAAIRDNSRGIAGIARAGIMAMGCGNVVADVNTNVSPPVTNSKTLIGWSANAINDAVANDATVVNCSFANSASDNALKAALTNAQNAGVVVIAAAGNNATNISLPASAAAGWLEHPWPVLVGSVRGSTVDGAVVVSRSTFGNFGPELDIAAPGSAIYSTVAGADYGFMDGTSMAAPHVAGAVAFTRSMNPDRIRGAGTMDLLYRMVEDVGDAGPDSDFGRGLLRLRPDFLRVLKSATTFAGQGAWLLFLGQSVGVPGTYENPYPSLSEALSNTTAGGTVVLNAGATNAAGVPANTTLTNAATLTAFPDRPVTFGGQ